MIVGRKRILNTLYSILNTNAICYTSTMSDTINKKRAKSVKNSTVNNQKTRENNFDPHAIELKWQSKWEKEKVYQPNLDTAKRPFYNLMMFPYPSAEGLHVGSIFTYGGIDAYGRFKRMQGYDVFEPIGLDGFGIHSENFAIKVGRTPKEHAAISEKNFYRQMRMIGNAYDWSRKLETYDPNYYKWTQWLFIELFKAGLAYKDKAQVNFCPSCKTVLSDEQVIDGKCERCSSVVEKRELEQWFFRITDYADRLLANTEKLDWTEKVKIAQKNWIGKSRGAIVKFEVVLDSAKASLEQYSSSEGKHRLVHPEVEKQLIEVFTTRPDTLYGATFVVVSPEHPVVDSILKLTKDEKKRKEITAYREQAERKSEQDRVAEGREKTGVFSGVYAINPVSNEQVPVWIADYVLFNYGTGAIMAVPGHDERDFAFAKKYDLPIKQVIAQETGITRENEEQRDGGCAVIFDPNTQKYAVANYPDGMFRLYGGGVSKDEDMREGILREVEEESGLHEYTHIEEIQTAFVHYYNRRKKVNRSAFATCILIILKSSKQKEPKLEAHEMNMELIWAGASEIIANWEKHNQEKDVEHWISFMREAVGKAVELGYDKTSKNFTTAAYTGPGILINSGEWNGLHVPEAIESVIASLEKKGIGSGFTIYHLRDWLISRQRYWGPPIPMIFCKACAEKGQSWFTTEESEKYEVRSMKSKSQKVHNSEFILHNSKGWYPAEDLPVLLPEVEDFKPLGTGKAPLANYPEFYKTTCPGCGTEAKRETDVSDTFLDSSWYFFRYTSTDIDSMAFDTERVKKWLPVTSYIGGAEHAVLHLLYSRFITMVLKDLGYISFEEPYARFRANGLIIKDGAKMSKSKGNVINPDDYVKKFGADTLRTYLGFIGPFTQGGDFQDSGIEGIWRFLNRVWKLVVNTERAEGKIERQRESMIHKTVKGVTEDMDELRFNTAIAKIMTYYNFLSDQNEVRREEVEVLLKMLAPFAPHITDELWSRLGNNDSIHISNWPVYEAGKIVSDTVTIAVQVNGKLRDTLEWQSNTVDRQQHVEKVARELPNTKKYLAGNATRKVIYVPGKILNFVI